MVTRRLRRNHRPSARSARKACPDSALTGRLRPRWAHHTRDGSPSPMNELVPTIRSGSASGVRGALQAGHSTEVANSVANSARITARRHTLDRTDDPRSRRGAPMAQRHARRAGAVELRPRPDREGRNTQCENEWSHQHPTAPGLTHVSVLTRSFVPATEGLFRAYRTRPATVLAAVKFVVLQAICRYLANQ
jgi:hypothetical protein